MLLGSAPAVGAKLRVAPKCAMRTGIGGPRDVLRAQCLVVQRCEPQALRAGLIPSVVHADKESENRPHNDAGEEENGDEDEYGEHKKDACDCPHREESQYSIARSLVRGQVVWPAILKPLAFEPRRLGHAHLDVRKRTTDRM